MIFKRIKKYKFVLVRILALSFICTLVLFLVSCGLYEDIITEETVTAEVETISVGEPGQQEEEVKKIKISIWEDINPKEQIALLESIEDFISLNPDIEVSSSHMRSNEELLDQAIATSLAGAGPELIITRIESGKDLADTNVLKEIPEQMRYERVIDGLDEIALYGKKEYVIPFRAFDFLLLYYNKELVLEPPDNFDELIAYCKDVNDPDNDTWGFMLNAKEPDWIIPFVGGYQGWIFDYSNNSITLNTAAMQKTLEFLLVLYDQEKIMPYEVEYADINDSFIEGRAHMIINGNWAIEEYTEAKIDFGATKIPIPLQGYKNPTPMVDGIGFMINKNCYDEKLQACKRFIDHMMSYENQMEWTDTTSTLPSLENVYQLESPQSDKLYYNIMQQLKISRGVPPEEYIRFIRDAVRLNFENVILQNITVEEAVKKMQDDVIKLKTGSLEVGEDVIKNGSEQEEK